MSVNGTAISSLPPVRLNIHPAMLAEVAVVPFSARAGIAPARSEQFARNARGRVPHPAHALNHLQTIQPLHTVVVTSPSPAEGKTFSRRSTWRWRKRTWRKAPSCWATSICAARLSTTCFRWTAPPGFPTTSPANAPFRRRCASGGHESYMLPAGSPVKNPLELLNMRQAKALFEELPRTFNWAIFDTPPLLFSADANLLATLADGTILVVKIGSTTFDNVTRAMQSFCENNVLGIVANGARASELYSKYTYYYSKTE